MYLEQRRNVLGLSTLALAIFCVGSVVVATQLAIINPLYGLIIVYVMFFWTLAWKYPRIALLLCIIAAPFQNNVGAGNEADHSLKFSVAEVNLALTFPVLIARCFLRRRWPTLGRLTIPFLIYLAACGLSTVNNWHDYDWRDSLTLTAMAQMVLYLFVDVLVFSELLDDPLDAMICFDGFIVVCCFLAIATLATGSGYVLGLHKNGVGASLGIATLICLELWFSAATPRRRMIYLMALILLSCGLIVTLSRGAWISTIVGTVFIAAFRRRLRFLLQAAFVLIPICFLCWQILPQSSRTYATGFNTTDNYNIKMRLTFITAAQALYDANPLFGQGLWVRKQYDGTNLFWLTLAESGIAGLVGLVIAHVAVFHLVITSRKYLAPTDPLFSYLCIGGGILAGKLAHGMVDHYWSRGVITPTWAAVGLALAAAGIARRRAGRPNIVFRWRKPKPPPQQIFGDLPPGIERSFN